MAPRVKRRRQEQEKNDALLAEMEDHMAMDRILEARKVVDQIQQIPDASISPKQQDEMDHIIQESDHVQELMDDLQNDSGWTQCRSRHGITVHYRNEEGDPIHAVKTRCILKDCGPTDFVHLCSLFIETDLLPLWFPNNIIDHVDLLAEPSKYRQVVRMVMKFHYMPISDREIISEGIGYHLMDENAILILTKSIESSPFCEIPPTPRGVVRVETRTAFLLKLMPGHQVEFCQISHDDLKFKYIPAFVLNYLSQGTVPFEFIQSFKRVMSNYEGSEWEKRVQQKRDFYLEIEERVHEELATVNVAPKEMNGEEPESQSAGLSLWTAVCIMSALVVITRWSVDRFELPRWLCVAWLLLLVVVLTHLTYLYQYPQK